jgi:hypothetical protein
LGSESGLLLLRERRFHEPLIRGFQDLVIALEDFRADFGFADQLLVGDEEVGKGAQEAVDAIKDVEFFPGVVAPVADIGSDESVVFLFGSDRRSANSYRFCGRNGCGRGRGFLPGPAS